MVRPPRLMALLSKRFVRSWESQPSQLPGIRMTAFDNAMVRRTAAAQPPLRQGTLKRAGGRAGLLGTSALSGTGLRGLAVAAGVVTAFGASPALAQCFSGLGS